MNPHRFGNFFWFFPVKSSLNTNTFNIIISVTSRRRQPVFVLSKRILFEDVATSKCSVEAGEKRTFSAASR